MKGSIKKWIKTRETGEFSKINENFIDVRKSVEQIIKVINEISGKE